MAGATAAAAATNSLKTKAGAGIAATIVVGDWLTVLGFIFGGCCSNVFALESLVREVPKCGNLITFAQFIFITAVGLPSHMHIPDGKWLPRLKPRLVPLHRWAVMVGLYFCVSILNNLALGYKISIPLHIVFRSSGLIANMVCGYIVMRKMYPAKQVVAVLMVTAGVIIATLASIGDASDKNAGMKPEPSEVPGSQSSDSLFGVHESAIGISLLTCGVFLAAMLGLYQETTYNKYGKHWKEGLFYNHALALPMFLLFRHDICNQIAAFSQSQPRSLSSIPIIGPQLAMRLGMFTVPSLWISLVANVLSQLVCVSGVHRLTSMSSSLTLNVVLNLRKLVSLVISVLLFKNAVNLSMLSGCALVFLGTFAYAQVGNGSGNGNKKKTDKDLKSSSLSEPQATSSGFSAKTHIDTGMSSLNRANKKPAA